MTSKPTQPTVAKTPAKPSKSRISVSMPKALLSKVDALATLANLSRAAVIEAILTASTSQDSVPAGPHVCPRGYRRPCDQPPVPKPS